MGVQLERTQGYKRRKKWVHPVLQSRSIVAILGVAAVVLLVQLVFSFLSLWAIYRDSPQAASAVMGRLSGHLLGNFLIVFGIAVGLSVVVGIYFSFRFSGPVYRFRVFFEELVQGRWDVACRLRDRDHLHDVKDAINEALDSFRERIESQHRLLVELRSVVEAQSETSPESERVKQLLAEARAEEEETSSRLGLEPDHAKNPTQGEPQTDSATA